MRPCAALLTIALAASSGALAQEAVRIHPENPKYLLFRGKPLVLISASEHYGSVINRPFDFEKYLDDAAAHKHDDDAHVSAVSRTAELAQSIFAVQARVARLHRALCAHRARKALDGEPIYDLDRWNPEYFDRLHRFLDGAVAIEASSSS